jgi:hypothetical protein
MTETNQSVVDFSRRFPTRFTGFYDRPEKDFRSCDGLLLLRFNPLESPTCLGWSFVAAVT